MALIAVVIAIGLVGAPALTIAMSDEIESVIIEDQHRPIRPVSNNLFKIGDLHAVDFMGNVGNTVCAADAPIDVEVGEGDEKFIHSLALSSGSLELGATGDAMVAGSSDAAIEIDVKLTNVRFERARSENQLYRVLGEQMAQADRCAEQIQARIEAGYCLAQIFSIMTADGAYYRRNNARGQSQIEQDQGIVKAAAAQLEYGSGEFRVGESLHYGVQLSSLCITDKDAWLVRNVPDYRWWVFTPIRNLFNSAWKYLTRSAWASAG